MEQQFHTALINGNLGINYKFHKKYGNLLADPVAATFAAIRAGAKDRTDFANKLAKSEREPEVKINDAGYKKIYRFAHNGRDFDAARIESENCGYVIKKTDGIAKMFDPVAFKEVEKDGFHIDQKVHPLIELPAMVHIWPYSNEVEHDQASLEVLLYWP